MIIIIVVVFICISEIRQLNTINNATNNATNNSTNIQEKFIIDPDSDTGQVDLSFLKDKPMKKKTRKQHENSGGFPEKYRDTMINPPGIANCAECECQGPNYIGCDYVGKKKGRPSRSNLMVCRKKNGKIARNVTCCGNKTKQKYTIPRCKKKWKCGRKAWGHCIWKWWYRVCVYPTYYYRGWDGEGVCENPHAMNQYLEKKF